MRNPSNANIAITAQIEEITWYVMKEGTLVKKPFQCDLCQKIFGHRSALAIHIRAHTGEQRYQCDICGNFFLPKSASASSHKISPFQYRKEDFMQRLQGSVQDSIVYETP